MSQQRDWAQIMKNNILLGHLIQQQQTKELIIVLLSLAYSAFLNPYHAELYTQDITCMLNCFEEILVDITSIFTGNDVS